MSELKIGSTVWLYNENRRVYRPPVDGISRGGPIYREHWMPYVITGETSRSWIVGEGWMQKKAQKKGEHHRWCFSEEELNDRCYVHSHSRHIAHSVERVNDAATLRAIAKLTGYVEKE